MLEFDSEVWTDIGHEYLDMEVGSLNAWLNIF